MLDELLKKYGVYGNEENAFECEDVFEELFEKIEDNEIDIQTILRFLIEETSFIEWIDKTFHNMETLENIEDECECESEDYEQINMFNAQADKLKETQEELKALKKKYNSLLKKYKDMKSSL